jgi:hypothetical protein
VDHDYLPGSKDAEVTDADIYQALVASEGNISEAARALCISRTRCKQRVDKNIVLTALLLDMTEEIVDIAAGNIFRDVRANDPTMNRFVAQTLGKERGFSTGVAGMGKNGEIVVQINRLSETKED